MYPVTEEYEEAVYAPVRTVKAKVTFDITDVTTTEDITSIVTTAEAAISNKQQLANKIRDATYNLATLEQNRFRLDGSFSFPDDVIANNGEMGFVSSNICGADGVFASPPTITFQFGSSHSSAGLTITFDQINGEYATDFDVTVYNASNTVIASAQITGNTAILSEPLSQIENYRKIEVVIKKWSVGNRRARVLEVDFGIVRIYDDESLISCNLIEEMDIISGQLPSPEFTFVVDNSDRAFNILNPTGFYKYLQQRQRISAELGLLVGASYQYVPIGSYLLWTWDSQEGAMTAKFVTRTNLDLMANFDYEQLNASNKSLQALAAQVFAICGITNYFIDPALASITTNSMSKKTDCKTLLQMIAIAGRCNLYVTRDNVITLEQLTFGAPDDRVDFDNTYQEPKIELEPIVKRVEVTYWSNLDSSAVSAVDAAGVDIGDTLKVEQNTLINNSTVATAVANWILAQKQYRAKYSINWRGNPAHELADVIAIENSYGADKDAMITKQQINYQGYLQVQTEAKGAVS